jgi:hypothetical protein
MFVVVASVLPHSPAAHAELAASTESIVADQIRFKGVRSASTSGQVTTHEIKVADGSSIKQYVNAAGVVFAVSWRTRLKPNLEALLGTQLVAQVASASTATGVASIKARQSVHQPNLVLHQGGRMNAFSGLAYVPTLVPNGIDAETLR